MAIATPALKLKVPEQSPPAVISSVGVRGHGPGGGVIEQQR